MAQDRVLFGTFWSDIRLAGLPPAGRLAYLFICANVDRDGFGIVDVDDLSSGIGLKAPATGDSAIFLLSAFNVVLSYGNGSIWVPDFQQPKRGALRVSPNYEIEPPEKAELKEFLSNRLGRIATERECKDLCPRAFGLKREARCSEYDGRVKQVWEAWRQRQKRPEACKFSPSVQRVIRGAMKEAEYTDLVTLIEYAYESSEGPARFWRGENKDQRTYLGLDNLLRSQKLQGRLQLVLAWKSKKNSNSRMDEVDLGPFARRGL
jgi:hypothetical protein